MKALALDSVRSDHTKKLGIAIVLAGMLLADQAGAGTITLWGAGNTSCGTWITNRRTDPGTARFEFSWLQGYITGLNAGLPSTDSNYGQVGASIDVDAAKVWVDNYCQAHPLNNLADAATELYTYARSQNR